MKKGIATFLAAILAVGALAVCPGKAAADDTYTITFAVQTAENTGQYVLAETFKNEIESRSEGKIICNLYPNGQLGGDREVLEAIQNDEITIVGNSTPPQANFVKDLFILDIPFVFPDVEAERYTLSDENFVSIMDQKYDEANFKFLGFTDSHFRVTSSNKPIHSVDDLKGMTIRTMENKFHLAAWTALGANPTPMAFNELYTALQQGTVDGQENPVELIVSQKFYEQQKYVIMTNHLGHTMGWVMSKGFYNSLPEDLQTLVIDTFNDCLPAYYDYVDSHFDSDVQTIKDSGTEVIELSEEELAKFAEKTAGVADMVKEEVSPEVYEAFMNSLEAYKASK